MAVITDLRLTLWDAIDRWPALDNTFVKQYRFDRTHAMEKFPPIPAMGELPALAIYPAVGQTAWVLNQHHQVTYTMTVSMWTHDWTLTKGEDTFEEIIKAWYQARNGAVPIVDRRLQVGPLSIAPVEFQGGGGIMTQWLWSVTLPAHWQPQLSS